MPRFEDDILGLIPQKDWLNVGFEVTRQNDPVDGLLTDKRTDNLVAEWESIASEYQIPSIAQFHSFDVESQTTVRTPIDVHNIEKGLIKVKINQSERMRALLRSGVQRDQMYDFVLNDGINLAEQVFTRSKVAKNELLATGKVTIKENNLDLTVDYGVPAGNTALTIDFGANPSQDVPSQIQDIIDNALKNGTVINGMVTSKKIIQKLRKNSAIQRAIGGVYMEGALVRRTELDAYLSEEYGLDRIITNDLVYSCPRKISTSTKRPTTETRRYFPENKITFFSSNGNGFIGAGLWGNPPEVDALQLSGHASAEYPYVYISQWSEKDPAVIWTKASALYMPVIYSPDKLYIATAV